jgi:hypothetical protein
MNNSVIVNGFSAFMHRTRCGTKHNGGSSSPTDEGFLCMNKNAIELSARILWFAIYATCSSGIDFSRGAHTLLKLTPRNSYKYFSCSLCGCIYSAPIE